MSHCNSLLIAGCGDVGTRLGLRMAEQGWRVLGMRRNVAALPTAIEPLAGDLHADACPADWPQGPLDYLVYCAAATQHDEAGYRAAYVDGLRRVLGWLAQHGQRPRRILFASSSGVYGQQGGEWVDEDSAAEAQSFSAVIMFLVIAVRGVWMVMTSAIFRRSSRLSYRVTLRDSALLFLIKGS